MSPLSQLPKIYLKPGELAVYETPAEVATVLGSCVSVTFYSPQQLVGAICHAMLPFGGKTGRFKYVDESLRFMLEYFDRRGIKKSDILVKVFGGADMFEKKIVSKIHTVGRQNLEMARGILQAYQLKVTAKDIGGAHGRKLIFYPHTGEVFLKRLDKKWRDT
jgi:chemotaxis protein CheD